MRRRIAVGIVLSLLFALALTSARADNIRFIITSRSQTDKPGSGEAAGAASALEQFVATAVMKKFKCARTLRQSELEALIGHERRRQLLGGEGGDEAMAAIAGGAGADYVASLTVIETGGKLSVNGSMLDTQTVRNAARQGEGMALDEDALDRLEAFAGRFVASFSGPVCPGDWEGTVTLKSDVSEQPKEGGSFMSTREVSFKVRGEGARSTTVHYKLHQKTVTPPDSHGHVNEPAEHEGAGSAQADVEAGVVQGNRLHVRVTTIKMVGKVLSPKVHAGLAMQEELHLPALEIPIPPKAETLTGSRTDIHGVLEWSFWRAKAASAR